MILQVARHVWIFNVQLITYLTRQNQSPQFNNLNLRWQQMVKFEDACDRILLIPSEYNWGVSHHDSGGRDMLIRISESTCHYVEPIPYRPRQSEDFIWRIRII